MRKRVSESESERKREKLRVLDEGEDSYTP